MDRVGVNWSLDPKIDLEWANICKEILGQSRVKHQLLLTFV